MNAMDTSAWTGEETAAAPERVPFDFKIEREAHKLEKRLCREAGKAIVQYNMIEEGDKVMVCMSGGKDSYTLLDILLKLKARAPIHFELIAVNLDQKQPGFPEHVLPDYLRSVGVPFHIENEDTYSIAIPLGATINMAGAAITISVLSLAAVHTLGIAVEVPTALLLCVVAAVCACGASGVAGGSLLLIPLACSLFGISNDVAMQVVAIGFIIGILQDSAETALNSSTDVLFTAVACRWAEPQPPSAR
jgi:hypothetical protein